MISIKNITKNYGETEILKNASYSFPKNGLICLLGPSGSGKSTLLNLMAGFDTEYEGSIYFEESNLSNLSSDELCNYRKDHVGFIFQDYHLISGYTVLENILLPCDLCDTSDNENINKAIDLLHKLGIESKKDEKIENLSGGQKQRVSIARALMKSPSILLADEPTGALDRQTSNEIMELLKSISENMLVVVITHDKKVCSFADEIIGIKDKNIVSIESKKINECTKESDKDNKIIRCTNSKVDIKNRAKKNFKVYLKQFIIVATIIALGIGSFILSLSSQNIMKSSIENFKEKNTAFNNGYIKYSEKYKDVFKLLSEDERVEDVYYQYKIENISIYLNDKEEKLLEYVPMPKSSEDLSYGVMPRKDKNEIAITPSLAKKLDNDISKLIGKTLNLKIGEYSWNLKISGIYNASYDSVFVSSNIEKEIYNKIESNKEKYSISYDVKTFEDVSSVNKILIKKDIEVTNASKEVDNLINTFNNLKKLFLVISILIFGVSLFISIVLLSKLQSSRFREMGLLSALGFNKSQIKELILRENMMLSMVATTITLVLVLGCILVSKLFSISLEFDLVQLSICAIATFLIVSAFSMIISNKLVKIEPAKALRM